MSMRVRRPVAGFHKLLLENKILLFFSIVMVSLCLVVLVVVYWSTNRTTLDNLVSHAEAVTRIQVIPLGRAVAVHDRAGLTSLLEQITALDPTIAYLMVLDPEDRLLAGHAVDPVVSRSLAEHFLGIDFARQTVPGFREGRVPLLAGEVQVAVVRVGVAENDSAPIARRAAGAALALMALPGVLLFGVARVAVRRTVQPLKDLTQVAEEISTGNLDPRIDFGVHVNCWEIMDCQQTDCRGYMNYSEQCWYIDGTPCEGFEPRFPEKLQRCRACNVYKAHRGDEVVQLADSFRHMTNVLKRSREELLTSDDFQKRLIQNSFDGIIATNEHDLITIFNRVAVELTGRPREEVIGRLQWQHFLPDELEQQMDIPLSHEPVRRLRGFAPRVAAITNARGGMVDVQLAGISLYERGRHIGKVFFFQDIREIKQLRERLLQSERLAAAGQAAAGISHSIKNILDGFNGGVYVYKAGKRRDDEEKMATGWDMIERNVGIIGDLVADLLNFAKERIPEYAPHDPRQLVEAVIADIGLSRAGEVKIELVGDSAGRKVMLDYHSFHQCLGNLLGNAMDAYAAGETGTITVEVGVHDDTAFFVVGDDGMGMSPRTLSKIKSGMFSTKGSKGTGLGLQVVQKIVNEHQGSLVIESEEDVGSTFRIELPVAGPAVDKQVMETT
ncbi:MAG: ATP-binding protein [bacterium]